MNDFAMSGSDFEEKTYAKIKNFKFDAGNNVFRILPALWSLATDPRKSYSKYWKTHWGFVDTEGKKMPVVCTERKNANKEILEHCAICDVLAERVAFVESKKGQVSDEQLQAVLDSKVEPYKSKGYYFAWAVDLKGDIGLLQMPKTVHDQFFDLGRDEKAKRGITLNGTTGFYVNISKTGTGKFGTKYQVTMYREPDPKNPMLDTIKSHELDEAFVNKIKTETRDLSLIYTALSPEDTKTLASLIGKPEMPGFISQIKASRKNSRTPKPTVEDNIPNFTAQKPPLSVPAGMEDDDMDPVDLARAALPEIRQAQAAVPLATPTVTDDFDDLFNKSFGK